MSPHDWARLISLGLKALEVANSTKASKVPMIQREITAPNGRKAVFVVPANEPPSVSIARMNPGGVVPPSAIQGAAYQAPSHFVSGHQAQVRDLDAWESSARGRFWFGFSAVVGVIAVLALIVRSQFDPNVNATAATSSHPSYGQATSAPPGPVRALVTALPRIQLKTGANVRNGPSRSATVLRVGQQGEVFTKFSEANGWLQIGTAQPEGWVAQSVVISVR